MAIRFATTGHFKGRSGIAKSGYGPAAGTGYDAHEARWRRPGREAAGASAERASASPPASAPRRSSCSSASGSAPSGPPSCPLDDALSERLAADPKLHERLIVYDLAALAKAGAVRSSVAVFLEWFLRDAYGVKVLASAAFTQGLVSRGVISLGMG